MPTAIASLVALLCLLDASLAFAAPLSPDNGVMRPDTIRIEAASCAANCRQQHNQCRIATRGASRCDAQLQRCLQGCLGKQKQQQKKR